MATDVDVQFFSHLNGLYPGNKWGDLIRMLDKALVTGINFTQITSASIDEQGDVHITLYSDHKALLLQVVEMSGFTPSSLNQKYRIKGLPSKTQLILKPNISITERSISELGLGKLAPLGYDIVFRDTGDVKRVYRAQNPGLNHPFIRVDETISNDTSSYASTYVKCAMVGLIENMTHIDDYVDSSKLQLPLDTTSLSRNWGISGAGTGVVRGWAKWYWVLNQAYAIAETASITDNYIRPFTLCGDKDAFYFMPSANPYTPLIKSIYGCGLFNSSLPDDLIPSWFLMAPLKSTTAATTATSTSLGNFSAIVGNSANFHITKYDLSNRVVGHATASSITPDTASGNSDLYSATNHPALELPVVDNAKLLRGTLKHIHYFGKAITKSETNPIISETSMYVNESSYFTQSDSINGGVTFYLGEMK